MRTTVLLEIVAVVALLLVVGLVLVVGPNRLLEARSNYRDRLRLATPHVVFLGLFLALTSILRDISTELSWIVGRNITATLHNIEGDIVAQIQSFSTPELNWFFTFVYIFGYIFLLAFPMFAYLLLEDGRPFRVTVLAYASNYGIGMFCYTLFIAFGPRNYLPGEVDSLIYTTWTEMEFVTTYVNVNTNVFPSLHTSLSVTVAMLAIMYRREYPRWAILSVPLAGTVVVATMYLGLHWLTDVVAGIGLAGVSVWLAVRVAARDDEDSTIARAGRWFWKTVTRSVSDTRERLKQ